MPQSTNPRHRPLKFGFAIAGSQKAATTSLSAMLDKHRNIKRAPLKEMHYFDDESRDWTSGDHSDYMVNALPAHRTAGDATPVYLWWPQALERMHAYNPEMRIISVFRDPIERLFSQWVMIANRYGRKARDWPQFLTKFAPDTLEDRLPPRVNPHGYRINSGIVRGYYGAQLEKAHRIFGEDQVLPLEFRAFLKDHTTALDQITDFLELPRFRQHPELPHGMPGKSEVVGTAPTAGDIEMLVGRYRDDFARFKDLSGLDVSHWPLQRLLEGTLAPDELAAKFAAKVEPPAPRD